MPVMEDYFCHGGEATKSFYRLNLVKLRHIDMKITPIQIDIEDKRLYAQIAFLVDRNDFLTDIKTIRKNYQIDRELQKTDYFEKSTDASLSLLPALKAQLLPEVAKLRHKYQYPPYFDDVILQVILFNRVQVIKSTQVVMHIAKDSHDQKMSEQSMEMAILLTPLSTKQEVIAAFDESKKLRQEYENKHPLTKTLEKDTLTNVVRDRNWYWQVQKDGNYKKLLKKWNERPDVHEYDKFHNGSQRCNLCYINDDNYLHHAVHEYRKRLG